MVVPFCQMPGLMHVFTAVLVQSESIPLGWLARSLKSQAHASDKGSCRVVLFGVTVAFYILLAIGVKRGLQFQTGVGLTPWPSWAWFIAIINSWLWLGLSSIAICGE